MDSASSNETLRDITVSSWVSKCHDRNKSVAGTLTEQVSLNETNNAQ